jgi:serine/threonine protein kinase
MALSAAQMAQMSRLLDEALDLDAAGRRRWLEQLAPEYAELAPALRQALLPEAGKSSDSSLETLPKIGAGPGDTVMAVSGLQPGGHVGPYQLVRSLGSGGMAEVWLARRADGAFTRELALKLPMLSRLRRDLAQRFAHERDILAALEHVNIARLYDAGVTADGLPYLAMEYVPGEPITAWCDAHCLGIRERIKLFLQVLDAAQYAHARQVIHRDIKPSNILVTQAGQVRLLDFGVAKLLAQDDEEQTQLTALYGRALTPDYASPEYLLGEPADSLSDIYSLGVLLYELLTGCRPYRLKAGASQAMLEQAIATAQIQRPSTQLAPEAGATRATTQVKLARRLRGDLDAIVMKALARSPKERYASASALADELQRYLSGEPVEARPDSLLYRTGKFALRHRTGIALSAAATLAVAAAIVLVVNRAPTTAPGKDTTAATAAVPEKSIAVLPFVDMSEKKDQEYFSDGLSEELIDMLTKVPELRVPARTSSFYFKGKQTTIADIAKALQVANVLEGSVRKSGNVLRVTAQLIRVDNGYHLWSQTYDRQLDDIFKIQDEIAAAVVKELKVSLLEGETLRAPVTTSNEAYEFYLQARSLLYRQTSDDSLKAYADLRRAVSLDPKFALAWATLAEVLSVDDVDWRLIFKNVGPRSQRGGVNFQDWGSSWAQARAAAHAAASQAIKLEPNLAEAHAAMATVLAWLDWDWAAADAELKRARELAPGNARITLAAASMAISLGRVSEGLQLANRAAAKDPLGRALRTAGFAQYASGALEEAEVSRRKMIELYPTAIAAHYNYALVLLARGESQAALSEFEREDSQFREVGIPLALDALGRRSDADHAIATAEQNHAEGMAYNIAAIYASRNDLDRAFYWLERAYRQHDDGLVYIKVDPQFRSLERDPRFGAFLRKMNLPE